MPWTQIVNAAAGGTANTVTTGATDTTGADLLVAFSGWFAQSGRTPALTDSKGNTWTALTNYMTSGVVSARFWWCRPTSVGSGHTFTAANTGVFPSLAVLGFSGSDVSPFDAETGMLSAVSAQSAQPGSISTTANGDLIVCGLTYDGGSISSLGIDSGFSIGDHVTYLTANHMGVALSTLIQGSSGSVNPAWSWTTSRSSRSVIASFKVGAAPTFGNPWNYYQQQTTAC